MLSIKNLTNMQKSAINVIVHHKKVAVFMKPGSGKTAVALYALHILNPKSTLIVAPPFVCETVWQYEHFQWEGVQNKKVIWLNGNKKSRIKKLSQKADIYLISYDLLKWLNSVMTIHKKWDAIIFDEVDWLQTPSSNRFTSIELSIDEIPISVGLTGTPTGNSLLGMWSQIYSCVGSDIPIGETHQVFKARYFLQGGYKNREWLPTKQTFPRIMNDLQGYAYSFKLEKEYCPLTINPIRLSLPVKVKREYEKLKKEFYLKLENGESLYVLSKGGLNTKLRQLEAGAIYVNDGLEEFHNIRIEALKVLIGELNGAPLIICYEFRFQLWQLQKVFGDQLISTMGQKTIKDWNDGKIKLLAINPKSCGHGLNLQHGGCDMIFMSVPWSLRLWEQTIGRLYRTGQKNSVSIYHFSGFEIEDRVIKNLKALKGIDTETFVELEYAS